MLSTIFSTMQEPETPKELKRQNRYHQPTFGTSLPEGTFWDNISFADERLVRTPFWSNKITQYLETLTYRVPELYHYGSQPNH
ncbi:MAG: hypothetical protein IPN94_27315 [Sphingobacteriales bacterium]|nr:hypothetical protein [Sphingobacteriales bacterium]